MVMLECYNRLPVVAIYVVRGTYPLQFEENENNGVEDGEDRDGAQKVNHEEESEQDSREGGNEDVGSQISSDPSWLYEGLEGIDDEDIFAEKIKNKDKLDVEKECVFVEKVRNKDQVGAEKEGQDEEGNIEVVDKGNDTVEDWYSDLGNEGPHMDRSVPDFDNVEVWYSELGNEKDMLSLYNSSDEKDKVKFLEFNEHTDMVKPRFDVICPPFVMKQRGRPKKLRRRGQDEPSNPNKVSKKSKYVTCAKCLRRGHNKRSSKNALHPSSRILKKKGTTAGKVKDKGSTKKSKDAVEAVSHGSGSYSQPRTGSLSRGNNGKGKAHGNSYSLPAKLPCFGGKTASLTIDRNADQVGIRWIPPGANRYKIGLAAGRGALVGNAEGRQVPTAALGGACVNNPKFKCDYN